MLQIRISMSQLQQHPAPEGGSPGLPGSVSSRYKSSEAPGHLPLDASQPSHSTDPDCTHGLPPTLHFFPGLPSWMSISTYHVAHASNVRVAPKPLSPRSHVSPTIQPPVPSSPRCMHLVCHLLPPGRPQKPLPSVPAFAITPPPPPLCSNSHTRAGMCL